MFSGKQYRSRGKLSSSQEPSQNVTANGFQSKHRSWLFSVESMACTKKKRFVLCEHTIMGFYGDVNFAFRQGFEKDIVLEKFETQKFQLAQKLVSDKVGYQK